MRMYTPTKTANFEQLVGFLARNEMVRNDVKCTPNAVFVSIVFNIKPAKSLTKKKFAEELARGCAKKPDLDNLIKAILDGLNGVVFDDDAQVVRLVAEKRYSDCDSVVVEIECAHSGVEQFGSSSGS